MLGEPGFDLGGCGRRGVLDQGGDIGLEELALPLGDRPAGPSLLEVVADQHHRAERDEQQ